MYSETLVHALFPCEGLNESFSILFKVPLAYCLVIIKISADFVFFFLAKVPTPVKGVCRVGNVDQKKISNRAWRSIYALNQPFSLLPYSRQRMTVLLLYFSEDERNTADLEETERRNLLIGKECLKIKWS